MNIYKDITTRTGGDIYIGVVGPVRTGKSTFIKRFMEKLVIPNMEDEFLRQRATDELPQSAAGKTIMTAEPKFIPEEGACISLMENASCKIKLIDCVGYIIPSALGYIENDIPRMVMTPWFEREIPFNMAAELGTKKVIADHSTIGIVITTDGSFGEIEREEYIEAEKRIVDELKALKKPFIVLMNTATPNSDQTKDLALKLQNSYNVPVLPKSCIDLEEADIKEILSIVLSEFPIRSIGIDLPLWVTALPDEEELKQKIYSCLLDKTKDLEKISQRNNCCTLIPDGEIITDCTAKKTDLAKGNILIELKIPQRYFYEIISKNSGLEINNDGDILEHLIKLAKKEKEYDRFSLALKEAQATGYGIVEPLKEEFTRQEPEIIKQGGRFGVRLKASAPSLHIIRADIETEIAPIVGTESQSKDLIEHLTQKTSLDPLAIWDSDIFGKSLYDLVREGLQGKLNNIPLPAREKMQETVGRIINEGTDGLICIIL